jgi:hypothetical protein
VRHVSTILPATSRAVVNVDGGAPTNLTDDLRAGYGDPRTPTWAPACTPL